MEGLDLNQKIGIIPYDKIITIEVSGYFYAKIMQLVTAFVEENEIDILRMLEELKTREPETPKEQNFMTLVSLCSEIETKAHAQGVVDEKTVGDIIPSEENDPGN